MLAKQSRSLQAGSRLSQPLQPHTNRAVRLSCRALPVPKVDVITDADASALVDLQERFKMADIDGCVSFTHTSRFIAMFTVLLWVYSCMDASCTPLHPVPSYAPARIYMHTAHFLPCQQDKHNVQSHLV